LFVLRQAVAHPARKILRGLREAGVGVAVLQLPKKGRRNRRLNSLKLRVFASRGGFMNADAANRLIREAAGCFNAGRGEAAEAVCFRILAACPDFIPALHLAAVIAFAADRMTEGTKLLVRLFARDPNYVPALVTMGDALAVKGEREGAAAAFQHAARLRPHDASVQLKLAGALAGLGRFAEAERSYLRALELDPTLLQARFNLGVLLMKQSRLAEAEAAYRQIVQQDPTHRGAWLNLGNVLVDQDRHDAAVHAYQQVLNGRLDADALVPMALTNLAGCLCELDRTEEAIRACRRALEFEPDYAPACINLGVAFDAQGQFDAAVTAYRRAIEIDPAAAKAYANLAVALRAIGEIDEAIRAGTRAIEIEPGCAQAHTNLGVALDAQGKAEEAVAAHRRAIAIEPSFGKAHANLAVALRSTGALDEALAASHRAAELEPSSPEIRFNHAHALLMNGHWTAGFDELRWGKRCRLWAGGYPSFEQPEWRGERFDGRTLLLFAEAGLGDTLQFVRYLPMAAERGGSILLQAQPALAPLLRDIRGVTVIAQGEPLPPFDLQLPLMRLAHVFGTTPESVTAEVPYLRADPVKREAWRDFFGGVVTLKVGVVWAGNPRHKGDRQRSIAADAVLPRLVISGVQLYSLQKEPRAADMPVLQALGDKIIDLAPRLHDFAETAAAVAALDLVISVDTSVAHLAGALGRPTWVLLPYALDWRWLRDREDSPWYPTMRLFRQERPQAWAGAIGRASEELARMARGVPTSAIDRTALEAVLV
jgi:tetratricopeptide (TPR) repeat protein